MPSIPTTPLSGYLSSEPGSSIPAGPQAAYETNTAAGRPPMRHMAPIIVIDDSPTVRQVVESSFERAGIPAVTYKDGIQALNALLTHETYTPELILLDIGMPKMDGYEVAQLLREHPEFEKTQIVMLSGRDGVVNRWRSKLVGARDFIAKPFTPSDLVARVCQLLGMDVETSAPRPRQRPHPDGAHG